MVILCPKWLRKIAKNWKPGNVNIYQVVLETFQCGSKLLSIYISNTWEDLRWSHRPRWLIKIAKNGKPENVNICQTMLQTFQCGSKLLSLYISNHWEDIWWSYAQNNLEKLPKTGNLKMRISTKSCYKLLSVVQNYFLYIFQIIERIYDDPVPQNNFKKCEKLETWKCVYLPSRVRNFSVWLKTTFYIYFKSLRGSTMIPSQVFEIYIESSFEPHWKVSNTTW